MRVRILEIILSILWVCAGPAAGQDPAVPRGETDPLLRLEAGGPTSLVTAVAFSPDGDALYAAGWDKVVRVWRRDPRAGTFAFDPRATYRVPIGPGLDGAINAIALSRDGRWLAVAGRGITRGAAGFRQNGLMIPQGALSDEMRRDRGRIYVFDTKALPPAPRIFQGHLGPVVAMTFAPPRDGTPPLLVSLAQERDRLGVARLWDVDRGENVASTGGLPDPRQRPGLAVWHAGPARLGVRVAIAANDETLYLWDVAGKALGRVDDGAFNGSVATHPDRDQLLTASFDRREGSGQLTRWSIAAGAAPKDARRSRLRPRDPNPARREEYIPRGLVVIPSPQGPPRHAAVLLRRMRDKDSADPGLVEYDLQLIDLSPPSFGAVRAQVSLGKVRGGRGAEPTLAVDPMGRSLAVGEVIDREIDIYSTADLLQGRHAPQRIGSGGASMRSVAFVRKGEDRGLVLSEDSKARMGAPPRARWGPRDLVLDVARGRTAAYSNEWVAGSPPLDGWEVRLLDSPPRGGKKVPKVQVLRGGRRVVEIAMGPEQEVTDFAILPPQAPRVVPIVAIASHHQGQPSLGLYNGETGEQVRQLTGHVERIRDLAFSDDGRLLATVAEDQTACIWSLTDLDGTLGRRGHLPGVGVVRRGDRLVVGHLEEDSPSRSGQGLRVDDAILGRVEGGRLEDFGSQFGFYLAISREKPGAKVTLRLLDPRQETRDVSVTLGQAVDERKPLFSLFLTRPPGAPPRDQGWIGWSPAGPYESSGPAVEHLLGWHFNTGKLEAPTEFASAEEYRKFHRRGLLNDLLGRGSLPPPPPEPPLPPPSLSMTADSTGPTEGSGDLLVRTPPRSVELRVLGDQFPVERVESVHFQVDDSPTLEAHSIADRTWSTDLTRLALRPGVHRVRASFRTKEATPQEFSTVQTLRYQPGPPAVELRTPAGQGVVEEPEFRFQAKVRAPGGVPVKVRLTHYRGKDAPATKEWELREPSKPLSIDERLALEPGTNSVELVAVNSGALEGHEELETSRITPMVVRFSRKPIPAPRVALTRTILRPEGSSQARIADIRRGEPVTVSVPRVRLEGEIVAEHPLHRADWTNDPKAKGQTLAGFAPGRGKSFAVSQTLELAPGPRTIWVRAGARDKFGESDVGADQVTIVYQPRVPEIEDARTDPPGEVLYLHQFKDAPEVRLTARLVPPADPHPFKAEVLINGKALPDPPSIDADSTRLTAEIPLTSRDLQIEVRLSNAWGESRTVRLKPLTFLRPPRVVGVEAHSVEGKSHVDVSSVVESPADLPVTKTQVTVERPGGEPLVIDDAEVRAEGDRWVVSAKQVPIEKGENAISVRAWNGDGPSRGPAPVETVVFKGLPPRKPVVELIPPSETTTEARASFAVHVQSPTKGRIELGKVKDGKWDALFKIDLDEQHGAGPGDYVYSGTHDLELDELENVVELRATNQDGISMARTTVSRITPPVRVRIDKLESATQKAQVLSPVSRGENRIEFGEKATDGPVWLSGRVVWASEEAKRARGAKRVQVWVNGFPQVETTLSTKPGDGLVGHFRAGILLNREANTVELKLPGLARAAGDPLNFSIACARPELRQRLHLLIIGVGSENEEEELKGRALEALHGKMVPGSKVAFTTRAFRSGTLHFTLCKDVRIERVLYQLERIRLEINPLSDATKFPIGTEVVVIYYQGSIWLEEGKALLQLRPGIGGNTKDALSFDELKNAFSGTRGATLCLLDVTGEAQVAMAQPWADNDSRIGLLSFLWLKPPEGPSPEIPDDARLLTVWRDVIPETFTLPEADRALSRATSPISLRYNNLRYGQNLPEVFSGLRFGNP